MRLRTKLAWGWIGLMGLLIVSLLWEVLSSSPEGGKGLAFLGILIGVPLFSAWALEEISQ